MDWMSKLDDTKMCKTINVIPQSHNAGTIGPLFCHNHLLWPFAQCQDTFITTQLEMGVRALD